MAITNNTIKNSWYFPLNSQGSGSIVLENCSEFKVPGKGGKLLMNIDICNEIVNIGNWLFIFGNDEETWFHYQIKTIWVHIKDW